MGPIGGVTSAVLAASVAALGLAGPAFATDPITHEAIGTYDLESEDFTASWLVGPCGDGSDRCIFVTQTSGSDDDGGNPGWGAKAHWSVGSWIMFVDEPDAITCKDGTNHTFRVNYSWDATGNTGSRSYLDPGLCGGKAKSVSEPFTLHRTGPPPPPPPPPAAAPPLPAPVVAPLLPLLPAQAPPPPGVPLPPLAAEAPLPAPAG